MSESVLVTKGTLTLPVGVLTTLHYGVSEVRLYQNVVTGSYQVGKRVSLFGREDTLVVQEAMLLRNIDHDNIADVYDVHEVAGSDDILKMFELMMPYYALGSVFDAHVKRSDHFGLCMSRDVAVGALRGLAHLHERHQVLHRDVKPANLFLSGDLHTVKLGDLGEAMAMDGAGSADPLTTPRFWSAPETFCGERYTVTSEIYSMGLSVHEMLCGPFPYDDYTIDQLSGRLAMGQCAVAPRHRTFPAHVPESLRRIVRKATRRSAGERYVAADQMTNDLLRAAFIDWSWPITNGDGSMEWSGTWDGISYRMSVRPVRNSGWRARGERRYGSGWRRVPGCGFDAPSAHQAAEAAFRHLASVEVNT